MEITSHTTPQNRNILLVKGLVKEQAMHKVQQALTAMPADSARELWIDCSHVDRMHLSSSSICSFVSELLKIRKQDVKVVLCGMNATTERLFRLLRLDTLFLKAKSVEEIEQGYKQQSVAA